MYVNLSKLPSPPSKYQSIISDLYAGLNTSRIPSEIGDNQCADLVNMVWKDGVLRSRDGQVALPTMNSGEWSLPTGDESYMHNLHEKVWNGKLVFSFTDDEDQLGYIAAYDMQSGTYEILKEIESEVWQNLEWSYDGGAFFQFGGDLYYKNRHAYFRIWIDELKNTHCDPVIGYVPVIMVNTKSNGIGDLYQPENRLSPKKEVWYNGDSGIQYEEFVCDGVTKTFQLSVKKPAQPQDGDLRDVLQVYIGAALGVENTDYSVNLTAGTVTILHQNAPGIGLKVTVKIKLQKFVYRLPVNDVDGIVSVKVKNLTSGVYDDYIETHTNPGQGEFVFSGDAIIFDSAVNLAPDADANVLNTFVKVVYSKENADAFRSIDECNIVQVFGTSGIETNCIVMAGATAQDNAFFWSGNDSNGMNPAYFPINQYNLVGAAGEPITAFGRQQNKLVIFQPERTSSAEYGMTTVDGRLTTTLNVRTINDRIGCDLPHSVQLVNNNLVWASMKHGIMYLKDSTYAYETLVTCISDNINDDGHDTGTVGLRDEMLRMRDRRDRELRLARSMDDGQRYWLFLNGKAYIWDYSIHGSVSDPSKLCWFYADGIRTAGAVIDGETVYHLAKYNLASEEDSKAQWLFKFDPDVRTDFGEPFRKVVQTKTQIFKTYQNLKNINEVIFSMDSSREMKNVAIKYITDYGVRQDLRALDNVLEHGVSTYPKPDAIRVRKPKCLHVHHFAVRLESEDPSDMNIICMQIFYTYARKTTAGLRM